MFKKVFPAIAAYDANERRTAFLFDTARLNRGQALELEVRVKLSTDQRRTSSAPFDAEADIPTAMVDGKQVALDVKSAEATLCEPRLLAATASGDLETIADEYIRRSAAQLYAWATYGDKWTPTVTVYFMTKAEFKAFILKCWKVRKADGNRVRAPKLNHEEETAQWLESHC